MKLMRTIAALSTENSNPRRQKRASHPRQYQYDKNARVNRRSTKCIGTGSTQQLDVRWATMWPMGRKSGGDSGGEYAGRGYDQALILGRKIAGGQERGRGY
jgi:uncharacterized membrane protein